MGGPVSPPTAASSSPALPPSSPPVPATTGRTQWDAAAELINRLGNALPWLLLLGGLVYLAYTLRQSRQEEVDKAHEELRKTYTQMSELTKNQISNIQSLDTLQQTINKNTNAQYIALRELEAKASEERRKTEEMKQTAEKARGEFEETEKKSKEKGAALVDYEKRERDLENRLKAQEDDHRAKSSGRAQEIADLQRFLKGLVDEILQARATVPALLTTNAQGIRDNYFADVGPSLEEFAAAPTVNPKALDRLIGLTEGRIAGALSNAASFAVWAKATSAKDPGTILMYVGAVGLMDDGYQRVLAIHFSAGNVTDVKVTSEVVAVVAGDTQDWSRKHLYMVSDDEAERVPGWNPASPAWSLTSMISSLETEAIVVTPVKGDPARTFQPLTPAELLVKHPRLSRISAEQAPNFAESLRMSREATAFDAAQTLKAQWDRLPEELRKAYVEVMNAAVGLNEAKYKELVAPEGPAMGRVAALALRPSFRIVWTQVSGSNEMIQAAAPAAGGTLGSMMAEYQPSFSDRKRTATFFFGKSPGRGWLLASIDEWADAAKKK